LSTDGLGTFRLQALRGATTAEANTRAAIETATVELLAELFARNAVEREALVSMIFTATADLDADFPAAAARTMGIADIPLLCAREMEVPGQVTRCIRVLVHLYTDRPRGEFRHVYLREARQLRTDLRE
jgi:chorismate mutase